MTVARVQHGVAYDTDCSSGIYRGLGWINTAGIFGVTFYNQITMEGQQWSGWSAISTGWVSFSPPKTRVKIAQSTSVYFGINIGGSGVYGQIGSVSTSWDLLPKEVYVVSYATGTAGSNYLTRYIRVC
ncbi:hypothetical protein Pisl_1375 [Pyrobaculum islandicum DSM 4184]|uniref:Uncharacterized protein n=1 Tax=Pyrobaculum islandicum (strain DSM 4184 / JCM 9189 / GEO3) TaxID=384616 RepID=A1RUA5_PYRIL|nr:hypothetical protein Pisl_1375 [Pyrobaculum islandicum DSM 4184]